MVRFLLACIPLFNLPQRTDSKAKSDFEFEDVKELIYHEQETHDFQDIISLFDTGHGKIELEELLKTINDAWNYFPHRILNGLSPVEKLLEYRQQNQLR